MAAGTLAVAGVLALLVGLLMGLLGGGGGFLYVLILLEVAHCQAATAVGTGIVVAMIGSALSLAGHARAGNVDRGRLPWCVAGGAVGAACGALVTKLVPVRTLVWVIVGVYALICLAPALLSRRGSAARAAERPVTARVVAARAAIGAVAGLTVGAFAINGGPLLSAYLTRYEHVEARRAVGTAVGVIAPLAVVGALVHVPGGHIAPGLLAALLPGAMAGGYVGAALTRFVSTKVLIPVLSVLALATVVPLLLK